MKTVIEMAREAETYATNEYMRLRDEAICEEYLDVNWHELRDERLVELVRADAIADEREACAKVCEDAFSSSHAGKVICGNLAAAIRARSNTWNTRLIAARNAVNLSAG